MGRAPVGSCNRGTARCVDARSYLAELRPCCRSNLIETMTATAEVLNEIGVRWWADYGTLLGAVRNPLTTWADYDWLSQDDRPEGPLAPGIVPHDKDCDLGCLEDEWPLICRAAPKLRRRGFDVVVRSVSRSIKVRYSRLNHVNVDLFSWYRRPDGTMSRRTFIAVDRYKGREFPAAWVDKLSRVEWEGLALPAPADPVSFCEFRYGDTWRTPVAANNDGVER